MSTRRCWLCGMLLGCAVVLVACGPSATTDTKKEDPGAKAISGDDKKTPEEDDLERQRKEALARSLQLRKVVVAEKPEYVPGVEIEAQKSFAAGVVSVYQTPPDYPVAASSFEEALTKDKNFMEAYFNLGMVYERSGKGEKALAVYEKALNANPESGSARAYVGKVYLAKAREAFEGGDEAKGQELETKAKALFDEVVVAEPDNVEANSALAIYWLMKAAKRTAREAQLEDITTAEDFVQNVLTVQPTNVVGLNTRGLIYLMRDELRIAKWIFENRVLALDPNSTEAYNNLGLTYLKLGDTPKAVINFTKAIQVNPENIEARMNLGAIFINYLNYSAAREHYAYVLALRPEHVEAVIGLGSCKVGMQEFADGFDLYRQAYKIDSSKAGLLLRIARIYQVKLVDFDKAITAYEDFIKEGTKLGIDVTEGTKGIEQARKMAEQMKKMEEEMAKAEAEAKKVEEEMKKKAVELEKQMKKVESMAHDYLKQIETFVKDNAEKGKTDKAIKAKLKDADLISKELLAFDTAFKEAREYIGMTMIQEAEPLIAQVQANFDAVEAKVVVLLDIRKVQKLEEGGAAPAPEGEKKPEEKKPEEKKPEEKKPEPAPAAEPKAEEKKPEPAPAAEPKAEEKKPEPAPAAEPKAEEK